MKLTLRNYAVVTVLALLLGAVASQAAGKGKKQKSPGGGATPAPGETAGGGAANEGASAYVRVWKAPFAEEPALRLKIADAGGKKELLAMEPPAKGASFTEYAAVAAGAATITVGKPDEEAVLGKPRTATFAANSYHTLLIQGDSSGVTIDVIDDAPQGTEMDNAELTVRSFAPGLTEFQVVSAEKFSTRVKAKDGMVYLRGLVRDVMAVETTAWAADGKESKWTTEVDFRNSRKATLLIYADPYGRIRPRVVVDGEVAAKKADE